MQERLTEGSRILNAGDELDPEILQTPVISVYREQGTSFIFSVMFSSLFRRKCAGKLVFGASIPLLLNRGDVLELKIEEMRAFPVAGTWRRQQSNPRLNPVCSRRQIVDQTWPFCCLLSKSFLKNIHRKKKKPGEKRKKSRQTQYMSSSCTANGARHGRAYPHAERLPSQQEPSREEGGNL